jgi:hypothetical protein
MICSPRRQPRVRLPRKRYRGAAKLDTGSTRVSPLLGLVCIVILDPWLTPWATDLLPLRGFGCTHRVAGV